MRSVQAGWVGWASRVVRAGLLIALCSSALDGPAARADDGAPAPEALDDAGAGASVSAEVGAAAVARVVDGLPLPNGRFFPTENEGLGYAVVDEPGGPPFWASFERLGGGAVLGAPVCRPFLLPDGRVYQATEYALLVWRPGVQLAERADVLDMMASAGLDDWLLARGIPPADRTATPLARLGWLADATIRDAYFGQFLAEGGAPLPAPEAIARFGLPASPPQVFDGHVTQRFQRGALRIVTSGADGAAPAARPVAVGGLLRESGLLDEAMIPDRVIGGLLVARAPRPQLTWRSDTGWGLRAAPPGSPTAATAPVPPTASAAAGAMPIDPAARTPLVRVGPAATASPGIPPTATPSSGGAAARPPALPQPGAIIVIRDIVNQGRAEYVVVANEGTAAQELTGWTLRSVGGGQSYTFPSGFVLAPGATVNVHSGAGDPAALNRPPADLFATRTNVWNNAGDTGQIVDPTGRVVSEKRYGVP